MCKRRIWASLALRWCKTFKTSNESYQHQLKRSGWPSVKCKLDSLYNYIATTSLTFDRYCSHRHVPCNFFPSRGHVTFFPIFLNNAMASSRKSIKQATVPVTPWGIFRCCYVWITVWNSFDWFTCHWSKRYYRNKEASPSLSTGVAGNRSLPIRRSHHSCAAAEEWWISIR